MLQVRSAGMYVGIALKPDTAVECVLPYVKAGNATMTQPETSANLSSAVPLLKLAYQ